MKVGQYVYSLPAGSTDVLNALYRRMNRPTGTYTASSGIAAYAGDSDLETVNVQTSPNGNIAINFGTDNPIYAGSIGILPGTSGSFDILLEYSVDGTTWVTLEDTGVTTWVNNEWLWYDIDPGQSVMYYRMRETGGNTLAVREFYIGNNSREIQMARLNRDDYTNLPNKNFPANQPYQFWFDRTIPQATIYLWPTQSDQFIKMTVWYSREIMNVGALTDELEVPQRWYEATIMMLAHRLALELPAVADARIMYLEKMATQFLYEAEEEERDKSPIYFAPNISPYTR
jgi:hypothetical protein